MVEETKATSIDTVRAKIVVEEKKATSIDTVRAKIEEDVDDHFKQEEIAQSKFTEAFVDFNAQIRQKLNALTSGLSDVQSMFSAFEAEFKSKFGELPVFQKGV